MGSNDHCKHEGTGLKVTAEICEECKHAHCSCMVVEEDDFGNEEVSLGGECE